MATSDFLAINTLIYKFSQFTQSTISAFSTQFNTDWSSALGQTVQVLVATAQPQRGIAIIPGGPVLYINSGQARTVTDGSLTNLSTTVTSATAYFSQSDVGAAITGTGIPVSTTIAAVVSPTTVTLSAAATATSGSVSLTITPTAGDYVGFNFGNWQVIPANKMSSLYVATTN